MHDAHLPFASLSDEEKRQKIVELHEENATLRLVIFLLILILFLFGVVHFSTRKDYADDRKSYQQTIEDQQLTIAAQADLIDSLSQNNTVTSNTRTLSFKVAGVTFSNPDGTNRQQTLAEFYRTHGGPGTGTGRISRYTYEGDAAFYVLLNNKIIGNIPADEVSSILPIYDNIDKVSVYVDRFTSAEGELIYYARSIIEY